MGIGIWALALVAAISMGIAFSLTNPPAVLKKSQDADSGLPRLELSAQRWFDGIHTVYHFGLKDSEAQTLGLGQRFIWDLGNGVAMEGREAVGVYLDGSRTRIQVQGIDSQGRIQSQGSLVLDTTRSPFNVMIGPLGQRIQGSSIVRRAMALYPSNGQLSRLDFDRHYSTKAFPSGIEGAGPTGSPLQGSQTANRSIPSESALFLDVIAPGACFAVEGRLQPEGFMGDYDLDKTLVSMGESGVYQVYRALQPGYFRMSTEVRDYYVFVSPMPSRHVDRPDLDWYLTQYDTGTTSNCGPTVTAMSIRWATGQNISVQDVRREIGWTGDGAVSLTEMKAVLERHHVRAEHRVMMSKDDIFDAIDKGHILAVSYDMSKVSEAQNPGQNLVGQHYTDKGGHYLALKGYSMDQRYIIVYDPIPSDWAYNARRYGDGYSMYGRNRYFPTDELWKALRSHHALEIKP